MVTRLLGVALLFLGGVLLRTRRVRASIAQDWRRRHRLTADAVIPGAGAIAMDGGGRAVLLVHGFGDTPQSLALQARALHERGWTVRAPLLPGHGRTLEAFSASRAAMWTAHVQKELEALRSTHSAVAIVGLSVGGALAVRLAARVEAEQSAEGGRPSSMPRGSVAALVLLAPFLEMSASARWGTTIWPVWSLWRAWVPGDAKASIRDPQARGESLGYGVASPRLLREVRRVVDAASAALGALRLPTLVVHSADDYRIPRAAAERSFARLGAMPKKLLWVERSGHVITADIDSAQVTEAMVNWLDAHVRPSPIIPPASITAPSPPPPAPPTPPTNRTRRPR